MRHIQSIRPSGGVIGSSQNPLTYTTQRQTSMPPAFFFLFSLCTFVRTSLSWLSWFFPFVLILHHTQHKHPYSRRNFVFCSVSVLCLYYFSPDCPGFAFYPCCTTQTTQISMPPAGSEPAIPASDRPQTFALARSATGIRTRNPSKRSASDPHLRPFGDWGWFFKCLLTCISVIHPPSRCLLGLRCLQ